MMGLLSSTVTGYLSLAQLLARSSPRGFQTACSLGYYTVFSDSKKRPLERHNSARWLPDALIVNALRL